MNTQHTPAPWHIGMKPGPIVYGPKGEQVANLWTGALERDERIANMRLIVAAPDLLSELRDLVGFVAKFGDTTERDEFMRAADGYLIAARAAIAKATP